MSELRFFRCNILGGFRLSDLNKNIKQGEYFFIDSHVAETSRAVVSALRERWMVEVDEKEASKHIMIPRELAPGGVRQTNIGTKAAKNRSEQVAIPDVQTVNKNLESRQSERNKLVNQKAITPDFEKVEKTTKERQDDSINKTGVSDEDIVPDAEIAAGPDFSKAGKKIEEQEKKAEKEEKKEDSKEEKKEELKEEKVEEKKEEKSEEVTVTSLSDDSLFDNSQLSTPNFDEKKESKTKKEVKKQLDTKIQRKKRKYTKRKPKKEKVEG